MCVCAGEIGLHDHREKSQVANWKARIGTFPKPRSEGLVSQRADRASPGSVCRTHSPEHQCRGLKKMNDPALRQPAFCHFPVPFAAPWGDGSPLW